MIKAVIFDMDGTLFDTERIYVNAWRQAGRELNFAPIEEAITACTGRNAKDTRQYFEDNFADLISYDEFMAVRTRYYDAEIERHGVPLKPGVVELLTYLKEQGIGIALATATRTVRTEENLQRTGLGHYFDVLVTGDMVEHGKPHPETFLTAAARLGVKPCECMGVEDSFNGVRAIRAAGMFTVMVPDTVPPTPEIEALLDAKCKTLHEVRALIENINYIQ
ncbi:MAG: HAD family phosphatase [Ruminococcaceae bacterium]|nr:HAD family phosphatase [Oscillospiraceae bacterium]